MKPDGLMAKQIVDGRNSRQRFVPGVNIFAGTVKVTLERLRRDAVLNRRYDSPWITDSVTVSKIVELPTKNHGGATAGAVARELVR